MKRIALLLTATILLIGLNGCKKYEGEGGRSKITGKLTINEKLYINGVLSQTVSYPGATEDVYIVYGTQDSIFDDKVECNYDGSFSFNFLFPGTYTVFAYNEVFNTGNYGKVMPVTKIEGPELQPGPVARRAYDLYMAFAKAHSVL